MKNLIITLLVLFSSLTSCKEKEKENINKKYHWVAYVKPVAGYPIRTYRGVVYGKDGASKFGTSSNFIFENDCPFPLFSISNGTPGLFKNAEEGEAKDIPTHLDVSWLSYVEKCQYLLENQPLDSLKIAQLLAEKVYTPSRSEDISPTIEEYNISVGLAPGGVVFVWLHSTARVIEVGRYQAKKIEDIHFVTQKEADEYYKRTGDVILDEHTIENRDYAIKLGMPKKKILMKHNECGTPVTESSVKEDDILKIPYGIWDTFRKRYPWKMTLITKDRTKFIHSYYYQGLNREIEELFGERIWGENQIEKYSIPEKFRYTTIAQRSVPFVVYIKFYDEKGIIYKASIKFNVKEAMDVFEKAFKGQEDKAGELIVEVNQEKTDINAHLKVGERNEWFCNGSFYISEDDEW
mgnify:FL=1